MWQLQPVGAVCVSLAWMCLLSIFSPCPLALPPLSGQHTGPWTRVSPYLTSAALGFVDAKAFGKA